MQLKIIAVALFYWKTVTQCGMNNYINDYMWDVLILVCPNFKVGLTKPLLKACMSNCIPLFFMEVIVYLQISKLILLILLVKGTQLWSSMFMLWISILRHFNEMANILHFLFCGSKFNLVLAQRSKLMVGCMASLCHDKYSFYYTVFLLNWLPSQFHDQGTTYICTIPVSHNRPLSLNVNFKE